MKRLASGAGREKEGFWHRLGRWLSPSRAAPCSPPSPSLQGMPRPLRLEEGELVDLGECWGEASLRGVLLRGTLSGAQLQSLPRGLSCWAPEPLEAGALLPYGAPAWLCGPSGPLVSLLPVMPRAAQPLCWGKALCLWEGRLISLELGGLEPFDLGQRLNLPQLRGFWLLLSQGGLRLLELPVGLRLSHGAHPLRPESHLPFEVPFRLEGGDLRGELLFLAYENPPVPLARLRYLGAPPEARRKHLLLTGAIDLGQELHDPLLARLRLQPEPEGVRLLHLPGHLWVLLRFEPVGPGALVPWGEALALLEVGQKRCLGLLEVLKP